ncbi:2-amino-4-hydroxy-6-hydroxymethyldihydropteridine diphosphokinase [Rickettsiales endosymbiont of Trichoplax sp. H2]|uniref:2-amino-4-hydroxy-6- hydroxymethyldihydropteridine diphosphokinase n=1 Tax=Rickettsiales endosymbiont of Trichoplax sp. H2 TaxID=2021221 RepID=UPI0012B23143|nr:2-amino-4-hydroxy-6-hydroxymethyldihydropteridine diphosphokinase [Rickettsiales endosymbiont of Trichoplax sp. H2]MSO13312.1 Folate synthesis bifunctional protein [Rickettsiales endosymbiont of Trichoplax sp. H2]
MKYIIGIGTNLGNKIENINQALNYIKDKVDIIRISSIYKSKALLKPNSPKNWDTPYFNLAILIIYNNTPLTLLKLLQSIESNMGKSRSHLTWSPRIIDLDILIAENFTYQDSKLHIPHPEFLNRDFALIPATEIAPDITYKKTSQTLTSISNKFKNSKLELVKSR